MIKKKGISNMIIYQIKEWEIPYESTHKVQIKIKIKLM